MLLLITNKRDLTADFVVLEIQRRQIPFVRLNTEDIARAQIQGHVRNKKLSWDLSIGRDQFNLDEITAAYYRRPGLPQYPKGISDIGEQRYCVEEWGSILKSFYSKLEGKWLNSPAAISHAEDKPLQLAAASVTGFQIPETIITNSPTAAMRFIQSGPTIGKTLRSALLDSFDSERVIFTTRIECIENSDSAAIAAAPFVMQREISKQVDIRATVVGDLVFAAEIHSQSNQETVVDWRRGARPDLEHRIHHLPTSVITSCIAVTRHLGLRFGAVDLVLDTNGEYWFLEINPNGQWAWIEHRTGLPIAAAIVDELERITLA